MRKIILCILLSLMATSASAVNNHISVAHVDGLYSPGALVADPAQEVTFFVGFDNDGDYDIKGLANAFCVYSPDEVSWTTMTYRKLSTIDWTTNFMFFLMTPKSITGSGADTIGFGGTGSGTPPSTGIPAHFNDTVYALTIGPLDPADHGSIICIDSCFYPPSGYWKWAGGDLGDVFVGDRIPTWTGPHCYTIVDAGGGQCLLPNPLVIKLETEEGNPPAGQSLEIDVFDDGNPLSFSLANGPSWLDLSASSGTTPATITASASVAGLTPGEYRGAVTLTAAGASNSPRDIQVVLNIYPVLSAMPFWGFRVVAEGGLQAPEQTLIVTATDGVSTIPFTAIPDSAWLTVTPSSGTTPETLVVTSDGRVLDAGTFWYGADIILSASSGGLTSTEVHYELKVKDVVTEIREIKNPSLPQNFRLSQNYPNPFNPSTTIRFAVPVRTHVELSIYNVLGRHVATLVNTVLSAAEYEVEWSGVDEHGGPVASGVYFYRIAGDTFSETKKMVLLK